MSPAAKPASSRAGGRAFRQLLSGVLEKRRNYCSNNVAERPAVCLPGQLRKRVHPWKKSITGGPLGGGVLWKTYGFAFTSSGVSRTTATHTPPGRSGGWGGRQCRGT